MSQDAEKTLLQISLAVIGFMIVNATALWLGIEWFEQMTENIGKNGKNGIDSFFGAIISIILLPFFFMLAFGVPLAIGNVLYFTLLSVVFGVSYFTRKETIKKQIETVHTDGTITREIIIEEKNTSRKGCLKTALIMLSVLIVLLVTSVVRNYYREKRELEEIERLMEKDSTEVVGDSTALQPTNINAENEGETN